MPSPHFGITPPAGLEKRLDAQVINASKIYWNSWVPLQSRVQAECPQLEGSPEELHVSLLGLVRASAFRAVINDTPPLADESRLWVPIAQEGLGTVVWPQDVRKNITSSGIFAPGQESVQGAVYNEMLGSLDAEVALGEIQIEFFLQRRSEEI